MKKYFWSIVLTVILSSFLLYGCGANEKNGPSPTGIDAESTSPSTTDSDTTPTVETTSPDTNPVVPDVNSEPVSEAVDTGTYDQNLVILVEAEDADFQGKVKIDNSKQGYTGTGYITGIEGPGDTVTFHISIPGDGSYDLNFISVGNTGHKENNILVDGVMVGVAKVDGDEFTDSIIPRVFLTTGEHQIQIQKSWGWILLDSLKVSASEPADKSIYEVSADLVDKKASERTKRLMQYLTDMYGEYVISGQYGDKGINGNEFKAIQKLTGEYPAILGLDFIEYTPSRVAHGSYSNDVEYAIDFDKQGGIVTFCWHWNAPDKYLVNSSSTPWWKGFYTEGTMIDLKKIMNGEDPEGYDLLVSDIDAIAIQLLRLQAADIPILWRPLHEASGGWFWWGASGPDAYIKLYQLIYDRLTNYHNIHNLIWVWNGQNKDWYPGDDYVDIVGTDIYPGERVYAPQTAQFDELLDWNGDNKKIITLSENGCLFDPDLAFRDNAIWSYFCTWEGEFVTLNKSSTLSEQYTEKDMIKKVYTSDKVITLDELPDF